MLGYLILLLVAEFHIDKDIDKSIFADIRASHNIVGYMSIYVLYVIVTLPSALILFILVFVITIVSVIGQLLYYLYSTLLMIDTCDNLQDALLKFVRLPLALFESIYIRVW